MIENKSFSRIFIKISMKIFTFFVFFFFFFLFKLSTRLLIVVLSRKRSIVESINHESTSRRNESSSKDRFAEG